MHERAVGSLVKKAHEASEFACCQCDLCNEHQSAQLRRPNPHQTSHDVSSGDREDTARFWHILIVNPALLTNTSSDALLGRAELSPTVTLPIILQGGAMSRNQKLEQSANKVRARLQLPERRSPRSSLRCQLTVSFDSAMPNLRTGGFLDLRVQGPLPPPPAFFNRTRRRRFRPFV